MDLKVFEILAKEVPSSVGDIREALDLLSASIGSTVEKVREKVVKSFDNKDFKKASELSLNSEELHDINKKIQEIIVQLDNIIDEKYVNENIDYSKLNDEKLVPNYSDYLVDTEVEHSLYEDFTYKRPCAFKIEGIKVEVKDWKGVFIQTINYLIEKDRDIIRNFVDDPKMNGKKRIYFSRVKLHNMIDPREIDRGNIYVETNLSANGIRGLLIKMLNKYNIRLSDYKIYLKADYSDLH